MHMCHKNRLVRWNIYYLNSLPLPTPVAVVAVAVAVAVAIAIAVAVAVAVVTVIIKEGQQGQERDQGHL